MFGLGKHKKEIEVTVVDNREYIIIEGEHYQKANPYKGEDVVLERIIEKLVNVVDRLTHEQKQKPIFALTTFINDNQFIIMADVKLVIGSPKTGVFTLIDNKTLSPITGVSFSNQAVGSNSNPEFATFALDTDPNKVIGTGVAAGSGSVVITTHADWTDPGDGSTQSSDFSVTKNFSVVQSADGASFDVVFD